MADLDLDYTASPTCAAFMKSEAYGRVIAGPVGSGKTVSCVMELLRRSLMQGTALDGYRYSRFAVVRQTLKQLKDTVLKDCQDWLTTRGLGFWKVSESCFHVVFDDVRSEWIFLPLDDAQEQARLLSMQLTGAWLSEAIEMDLGILGPVTGRIGRYPSGARGQPTWMGVIADTNMPTLMSPWHQFLENVPPNWQRWIQPGGLDPGAENLNWLLQTAETIKLPIDHPVRLARGRMYYQNLVAMHGNDTPWTQRYVHAQYGDDPSGMAVFRTTFRPQFHIVDHTTLIPGYPLIIAQDFGRNPWSLICQPDHLGRLIVHEEVAGTNTGLEQHVMQNLKPRLFRDCYLGYKFAAVGDPAGIAKDSISEESPFDALKRLGLPAIPAPTNDIEPRLRAVEALLVRQVLGGPALVINRGGCPMLCRAMGGGYRFVKTKLGGLKNVPEKNDKEGYSHIADCLQYAALVVHGGMMPYVFELVRPRPRAQPPRFSAKAWT